jgi:hypothetical protein
MRNLHTIYFDFTRGWEDFDALYYFIIGLKSYSGESALQRLTLRVLARHAKHKCVRTSLPPESVWPGLDVVLAGPAFSALQEVTLILIGRAHIVEEAELVVTRELPLLHAKGVLCVEIDETPELMELEWMVNKWIHPPCASRKWYLWIVRANGTDLRVFWILVRYNRMAIMITSGAITTA